MSRQVDMFDTMVRHPDHATSVEAAVVVYPETDALREQLWQIIDVRGPITALELEELPQYYRKYASTTVRKRVSELLEAKRIRVYDRRSVPLREGRTGRAMSYVSVRP